MNTQETDPMSDDMGLESPPTGSQDTIGADLVQGYQFSIIVRPEGFTVLNPEPIHAEPALPEEGGEAEDEEVLADRTELVKAILGLLEANPVGDEGRGGTEREQARAQMKKGFDREEEL